MHEIGPCTFSQLPQHYQELFGAGQFRNDAHQFFPSKPSTAAVPMAAFFSILYLFPAVGITAWLASLVYQDPTSISRVLSDATSGWGPFVIICILVALFVGGVTAMLSTGIRALADARVWFKTRRALREGAQHYGLLLDGENLVVRHGDHFDDYRCAFLPRSAITECFVGQERVHAAKRSYVIDVVKIWYLDDELKVRELVLKEHFGLPAAEMCEQIQQWRSH